MAQPPPYTTTTNHYYSPTSTEIGVSSSVFTVPTATSARETSTPTLTSGYISTETLNANQANKYVDSSNFWNNLEYGAKIGIVLVVVVGILCIVLFSMWYCCGCCGGRCCGKKRRRTPNPSAERGDLPLHTIQRSGEAERVQRNTIGGDLPPPRYEEAVPPQHQTVEGGITHVRDEEEGVISDGKTPLSEIPFEDVRLDQVESGSGSGSGSSSSANAAFGERHHAMGGDTRGHTNS
jgi:hypothetical protein